MGKDNGGEPVRNAVERSRLEAAAEPATALMGEERTVPHRRRYDNGQSSGSEGKKNGVGARNKEITAPK